MKGILDNEILEKIRPTLIGNKKLFFSISEGIFLPRERWFTEEKFTDIQKSRNERVKDIRELEGEFINLLIAKTGHYTDVKFVQQFPVIVENEELWRTLCYEEKVPTDQSKNRVFYLDAFLPKSRIALEVDYEFTHCHAYDLARDRYLLEVFGINTIRFMEFYNNGPTDMMTRELEEALAFTESYLFQPRDFDYSKTLLKNFELKYHKELNLIDELRTRAGWDSSVVGKCKNPEARKILQVLGIKEKGV